jgi:hypothetical protein
MERLHLHFPFHVNTEVNMSTPNSKPNALKQFVQCLKNVPDPRKKRGSYPLSTLLALTILGLIANCKNPTELQRWTKNHLNKLRPFLSFRYMKFWNKPAEWWSPNAITFTRLFEKLSLADLQHAFAEFVNIILADTTIVGAVDGKAAKQMKDANGDPILMLNVFAQKVKLFLASWNVQGDKTNEPGCLKKHLGELFEMYPCLKLLTGDAIFTQRPLLEAIQEYERDYLFQVKDNQPKVLKKLKEAFKDAPQQEPDDCKEIAIDDASPPKSQDRKTKSYDRKVNKKRGLLRYVACG